MTGGSALAEAVREFAHSQGGGGIPGVDVEVQERAGAPVVLGRVLTQRQAREVRELAGRHQATADVKVAADPDSGLEQGWVEAVVDPLDLWREPSRAGEEMGRQTQYAAADGPLRKLGSAGDFALVQGRDLALGWARAADLRATDASSGRQAWAAVVRPVPADALAAPTEASGATLIERARAELGVPYVWGGTTHAGFDCSGLLQRVFVDATGVLLPRHTGDQRRVGRRVVEGVRAGDLLFARPREQKVGHVVLVTSPTSVLHACRTEHLVIEESLEENARRYLHQGYRRPVALRP